MSHTKIAKTVFALGQQHFFFRISLRDIQFAQYKCGIGDIYNNVDIVFGSLIVELEKELQGLFIPAHFRHCHGDEATVTLVFGKEFCETL